MHDDHPAAAPHDHAHGHDARPDDPAPSRHEIMGSALAELLVEKGILTAEEIRAQIERMDSVGPSIGARVVARAWRDPAFKARLLADGSAACRELGIEVGALKLVVVENTHEIHNLVVCTLCSCYPRLLLGLPPDWYKSHAYRARAVREPRAVLREFGTEIPDNVALRVHDSTADMRYLVLPARPGGTDGMGEEALAALVTRDSMIGVALPRRP